MSLSYHATNARSAERLRQALQRKGTTMSGQPLWTEEECKILARYKHDYRKLERELPQRSPYAIRKKCQKLRLLRPVHFWTAAEISKLRKMYPTAARDEICSMFPHSTWVNIMQVARYHGIRRRSRDYKLTGFPALDEVRRRCKEIRWTMMDLDRAAKTGTYFTRGGWWGRPKINHRALGRAIEALDGTVQVEWNSDI